jgi:cobalt-zinc-cadmium efflux system membrane fusion protein
MIDQSSMRLIGGGAAIALVAALGGYAVSRSAAPPLATEAPVADKTEARTDELRLSQEAFASTGIMVETVAAGGLSGEIISQAIVSPSPSGEAIVTARAGGAVTRVLKRLGDPVRAGEALALVESREAAQISADTSTARAKSVLAQKALSRERYLYNQKVSARVDLEQAQAGAAVAAAESRRSQAAARAARVSSDGRTVVVASPISGRVTASTIRLGAFVQPEAELFRVSDPRQVQIEAAVGPADASRLVAGDRAVIELPDGRTLGARVRAVTPTLNGETRSATAVLDITGGVLQPGLAVRVRLLPSLGGTTNAIVVPEEAVQSLAGRDVIFLRTAKGFRAKTVTTGQRSAGRIEIVSGLQAGQTIATSNAFLLKAELAKSAGEEE